MSTPQPRKDEVGQFEHPNWEPLLNAIGEQVAGDFMWMHEVDLARGGHLQAYKHIDTRRHLHLDARGGAYEFIGPSSYRRVPMLDALVSVFASLPRLGGVADEQLRRTWQAVEHWSVMYIPRPRPVLADAGDSAGHAAGTFTSTNNVKHEALGYMREAHHDHAAR